MDYLNQQMASSRHRNRRSSRFIQFITIPLHLHRNLNTRNRLMRMMSSAPNKKKKKTLSWQATNTVQKKQFVSCWKKRNSQLIIQSYDHFFYIWKRVVTTSAQVEVLAALSFKINNLIYCGDIISSNIHFCTFFFPHDALSARPLPLVTSSFPAISIQFTKFESKNIFCLFSLNRLGHELARNQCDIKLS